MTRAKHRMGDAETEAFLMTRATGFVSGHDFSRAVTAADLEGFSPCVRTGNPADSWWKPPHSCGGRSASALRERVVTLIMRFSAGNARGFSPWGQSWIEQLEHLRLRTLAFQAFRVSFLEESRMSLANATNLFRKSRGSAPERSALCALPIYCTLVLFLLGAVRAAAAQTPVAPQGKPVVLDHVVAVINGSVILQSDVNEEMDYAVLQPFSIKGDDDTPQTALQHLIDRALILQQMETAQTVDPPSPEAVQQSLTQLRGLLPDCARYQCKTDAGWQAFLAAHGLTEQEVQTRWTQRLLLLSFIQSRFGAGVRITPAEIADYYNKTLLPQFQGKPVKPPALEAVSSRIQEILLQKRVSSLLLDWLQSLKGEGSVSILDPAYGKVGTTGSGDETGGSS